MSLKTIVGPPPSLDDKIPTSKRDNYQTIDGGMDRENNSYGPSTPLPTHDSESQFTNSAPKICIQLLLIQLC
jgi:hypothetical protein